MPLIIAATDFSDVAENAVNYACSLATAQKAEVMIIHSFIVPIMFSDVPMPVSLMNDEQQYAETQMEKLVARMSLLFHEIKINGRVIYGDTISVIEDYSEQNSRPWLVVVGNSSSGENSTWPDSVLVDAFKKLEFPVLGVPQGALFDNIQRLCLAFDNKHSGNNTALQQVTEISKRLNAELHVLNVQPDVHNQDNNPDIDKNAKNILDSVNARYHFIFESANVDGTIKDYIAANDIDWLIMIPRKHSFFEGLFHRSHTKSVAHHIQIPILALHDNG